MLLCLFASIRKYVISYITICVYLNIAIEAYKDIAIWLCKASLTFELEIMGEGGGLPITRKVGSKIFYIFKIYFQIPSQLILSLQTRQSPAPIARKAGRIVTMGVLQSYSNCF